MPNYQQLFSEAQKRQALADQLSQRALQSRAPQQQGRITPSMGLGEGFTQIAEALLARRAGKQADKAFTGAEDARSQAMADALQGMGSPSKNPYATANNAIEAGVSPGVAGVYMQNQQPGKPETTDDLTEYEFARQQGYEGTFQDFIIQQRQASAANTTVNNKMEGAIPQGYKAVRDEQGNILEYQPIPGSPQARELEATKAAEQKSTEFNQQKGDIVLDEIGRAFGTMENGGLLPETGFGGVLLKDVPGTDAHALQNALKTVRSNVGFDRLQQMRDASPTGGALGQVSERELSDLQSVMGSLEQSQRAEDLQYNLARLNNIYLDIIHGKGVGPERRKLPELNKKAAPGGTVNGITWSIE